MAEIEGEWHGVAEEFGVGQDDAGYVADVVVEEVVGDEWRAYTDEELDEMVVIADALDLLDGFYDERKVRPLAPPTCVITKWGWEWMKRALFGDVNVTKFTVEAVRSLDVEDGDAEQYIEKHTYTDEHRIVVAGMEPIVQTRARTKHVLVKGKRSNFAACVAHEAYNKFGARPMTEANVLVTRRWLQKLLAEPKYKDLRTVDKNIAIDRALFLSFVPTNEFRKMKIAVASRAWQKRVDPAGLLGGLFGKAFMLIRDDVPDGAELE